MRDETLSFDWLDLERLVGNSQLLVEQGADCDTDDVVFPNGHTDPPR